MAAVVKDAGRTLLDRSFMGKWHSVGMRDAFEQALVDVRPNGKRPRTSENPTNKAKTVAAAASVKETVEAASVLLQINAS